MINKGNQRNLALIQVPRYQQFTSLSRNQAKLMSVPESVPAIPLIASTVRA
jgi:hypothetical protein